MPARITRERAKDALVSITLPSSSRESDLSPRDTIGEQHVQARTHPVGSQFCVSLCLGAVEPQTSMPS